MEYKESKKSSAALITNEFPMLANQVAHSNDGFWYQFYHRLASDCEYWLLNGNRCDKHLWTHDRTSHILLMENVINLLPIDWIDSGMLADLERFKAEML